jgi:hypothetical protein
MHSTSASDDRLGHLLLLLLLSLRCDVTLSTVWQWCGYLVIEMADHVFCLGDHLQELPLTDLCVHAMTLPLKRLAPLSLLLHGC